jgi:hypothetical protein
VIVAVASILFVRHQIQRHQSGLLLQQLGGEGDVQVEGEREPTRDDPRVEASRAEVRRRLFDMLQPVPLKNCELTRFGERNDGGYLMCGNLLADVRAGYSYGISGYDKWGCDISTRLNVKVHQYDCFDTRQPVCAGGDTIFHAECVGDTTRNEGGRPFDTLERQIARNGDATVRVVLKMDVEGAEWESLLHAPDEVLERVDQMAIEFHKTSSDEYLRVVERLKRFFLIAHIHFNNVACIDGLEPFPSWAYEVLFVNRRLGVVDPLRKTPPVVHPLDARNNGFYADCQPEGP